MAGRPADGGSIGAVTAKILDGKAAAAAVKDDLRARVKALADRGVTAGLGTVLVGDDPGSHAYVDGKHRDCAEVGITSIRHDLPADATQEHVEAVVADLNADDSCTGFIVQLPLPKHIDTQRVLELIDPDKDADGLHPVNLGRLVRRGTTVGRPLGLLLTRRSENSTVTLCHTGTRDLATHTRSADIVVAAVGVPGLVTQDMVKPGATVVDVGITRVVGEDGRGRYIGDVAPEVREVAGAMVPVPGGIGPMTRAMLLTNVVERAEWRSSR